MDTFSSSAPPEANPTHRLRRVHILGHPVPLQRLPPNVLLGLAALAAVATSWLLFSTLAHDIARARTPCEPEAAGNTGLHHGRRLSAVASSWNSLASVGRSSPGEAVVSSKVKHHAPGIRGNAGTATGLQRSDLYARRWSSEGLQGGGGSVAETAYTRKPGKEPDNSSGTPRVYQAVGGGSGRSLKEANGQEGVRARKGVEGEDKEGKGRGDEGKEEPFEDLLEEDETPLVTLLQKQRKLEVQEVELREALGKAEGKGSHSQSDMKDARKATANSQWRSEKGSSSSDKDEEAQLEMGAGRGVPLSSEQLTEDEYSEPELWSKGPHHTVPFHRDPLAILVSTNTYPTWMWRNSSLVSNFPWKLTDALLEENEFIYQENLGRRTAHLADVTMSNRILDPLYPCPLEERFGAWGEGGKWICLLPYLTNGKKKPVVYSIGCAGDTGFEYDAFAVLGTKPHTYDHTVSDVMQAAMKAINFITFQPIGLGGKNSTDLRQITPTMVDGRIVAKEISWEGYSLMSLKALMAANGHKFIDVFKIDCEGCEIGFAEYLAQETVRERPLLGQILVEIHSLETRPQLDVGVIETLEKLGYRIFHSEQNWYCGTCYEIAFVHESLVLPRK